MKSSTVSFSVRDAAEVPRFHYLGKDILEKAICALLCEKNLLLAGPKATGKNVLCREPGLDLWPSLLECFFSYQCGCFLSIGTDTFDGEKVVFRPGPVYQCARYGGFGILDEINMAKNEAMAVLHATLDYRRILEVSGYDRIVLHPAARFIGTMNYGYAGTRELNEALGSRFGSSDADHLRETAGSASENRISGNRTEYVPPAQCHFL